MSAAWTAKAIASVDLSAASRMASANVTRAKAKTRIASPATDALGAKPIQVDALHWLCRVVWTLDGRGSP